MKRFELCAIVAIVIFVPMFIAYAGVNIALGFDDAYAQWGAAEMVIDYMRDHDGNWPSDWDSLKPYFYKDNGNVSGWSYAEFQSHIDIDFDADADRLRRLSLESDSAPFDVIDSTSMWGSQFEGGPNEMLYLYFRDTQRNDE
jgi:hypothetical protein